MQTAEAAWVSHLHAVGGGTVALHLCGDCGDLRPVCLLQLQNKWQHVSTRSRLGNTADWPTG